MSQYFSIHPDNPQQRLIAQAAEIIRDGGVIAYPTDSSYALGCHLGDKTAQERIRAIRGVDDSHHFTLVCRNLAEIATYAKVDNSQFRLLKANTPGSYTFILQASREVPRRLLDLRRDCLARHVARGPAQCAVGEKEVGNRRLFHEGKGEGFTSWRGRPPRL